jgi:hypothetical protein
VFVVAGIAVVVDVAVFAVVDPAGVAVVPIRNV